VSSERPGLSKLLVHAISRALARTPAERHPTATAMAQDLEAALAGSLTSALETQVRLGRAVADARRHLGRKVKRPESRSTLRVAIRRSRIDLTRRPKD
jgi:hypothetical protein